jgi:SPP1 gp7 family putative phage head morphogenesis protein
MRLQLDGSDDEAESVLLRSLSDHVTPRLDRALREWLREVFPDGMSEAEIADWERRLRNGGATFRDVLERALIDSSDLGVTVALDQLAGAGIAFDWMLVNTAARENARQYAGQLITQITDTTRRNVQEAVARWVENGEPLPALVRDLRAAGFSARRAKLIAQTETTGAFARANEAVYRESGVVQEVEWVTVLDERVCPTCGSMNGMRRPLDGFYSNGIRRPSAHPGCRCFERPVINTVPVVSP